MLKGAFDEKGRVKPSARGTGLCGWDWVRSGTAYGSTNRAIRQRSDAHDTDLRGDPGITEGRGHRRPRHIMPRRLLFRPLRADRIACWLDANGCSGLQACAIAVDQHRSVPDVIGQLHREHASKAKLG